MASYANPKKSRSEAGQKRRSRSTTAIAANLDSGAALTDSSYLDKLQKSLQQASITSLQDRLVERQLKEEKQPAYSPLSVSVRPKVLDKNASSKPRVKKTSKTSTSDGRESVSSQSSQGSSDSSTKVAVKKSTPVLRQRATAPKLFDQSQQKVDDLYRAAEQLILPPARRDPVTDGHRSRPQSPLFEPLADDVQLVDYWDTKDAA